MDTDMSFKVIVYNEYLCKLYGMSKTIGEVYSSVDYSFEQLKEKLINRTEDWIMVDYNNKKNLLLTSRDNFSKTAFGGYYAKSGLRKAVKWPKKIFDVMK